MSRQDSTKISDVKVLLKMGANGSGIASIEKTGTSLNVDTYTITLDDGTKTTFTVTNGTSIASIEKTGTVGLVDTYTITLTDGSTSTFEVVNGEGSTASSVPYDNTVSELTATNVQDAIDEIDGIVDEQGESIDGINAEIDSIDAEIADMNNILGAKNLCPNTATTQTSSGIIYTVYGDGSVNVSGTPSENTFLTLGITTLPKGTYKLTTGHPNDEENARVLLYVQRTSDNVVIGRSSDDVGGALGEFTLSNDTEVRFSICTNKGDSSAVNRGIYPMCKPASIKDETYVPYSKTNSQLTLEISNLLSNIKIFKSDAFSGTSSGASYGTVTYLGLQKGRYLIMYNGYNSLYGGYLYKGEPLVGVGWVRTLTEITLNEATVLRVQAGTADPVTWTNYQLVAIKVG